MIFCICQSFDMMNNALICLNRERWEIVLYNYIIRNVFMRSRKDIYFFDFATFYIRWRYNSVVSYFMTSHVKNMSKAGAFFDIAAQFVRFNLRNLDKKYRAVVRINSYFQLHYRRYLMSRQFCRARSLWVPQPSICKKTPQRTLRYLCHRATKTKEISHKLTSQKKISAPVLLGSSWILSARKTITPARCFALIPVYCRRESSEK